MSTTLLDLIVRETSHVLAPLLEARLDPLRLERLLATVGAMPGGVPDASFVLALEQINALRTDLEVLASQSPTSIGGLASILEVTRDASDAVRALGSVGAADATLGADLLQRVTAAYLYLNHPVAYAVGVLLGIIAIEIVPGSSAGGQPKRLPFERERFHLERVPELLHDPVAYLKAEYVPEGLPTVDVANATADRLFPRVLGLLRALGIPARCQLSLDEAALLGELSPMVDRALLLQLPESLVGGADAGVILTFSSADRGDLGLVVSPFGQLQTEMDDERWSVKLTVTAGVEGFAVGRHGFTMLASPETTSVTARAEASSISEGEGASFIFGPERGTRLEVGAVDILTQLVGSDAHHSALVSATASSCKLVVTPSDGDGFLGKVLPAEGLTAAFDLGFSWSSERRGVTLRGAAGLDTILPIGFSFGPLAVDQVRLAFVANPQGVALTAGCQIGVKLGPLQAVVEGVGMRATLDFPESGGNLGLAHLSYEFAPPTGVGLVINTSTLTGGGFLQFDRARNRYSGALALEAQGLSLSALGILDANSPGGGYSLVAVISSEFTPVQLGLGFTLEGVGGLVGVNRRVDTDALRAALRGPGVGDVFFSENPVAQAGRLLGDLARFFPAAEGRHVFGPAVKIGWAGLIKGEIALLLEVPEPVRLVLIGSVCAALPSEADPIILLNVDVVGEVDFTKKLVAVDASLRDSKVAGFPITGDLAFRMGWGDPPSFVLSVGGFHSQFRAPPGFPKLRRVTIPVGSGDNPRLDVQGFLALTSNTAQVGAQVELYAAAGSLNLKGSLGFETLIEFSPFSFRTDLSAGVALRRNSRVLASVHLDATLTGPSPWHIWGEACLSLWFVDLCVDFDATFGRSTPVELPQRRPWDVLRPELQNTRNWSSSLPPGGARAVSTTSAVGPGGAVLVEPLASLTVRQKAVPLGRKLTRFGNAKPQGEDRLEITAVKVGQVTVPSTSVQPVKDWFAPAQFEELPAKERLSRDGFEKMVAGVTVAGDAIKVGSSLTKELKYETIVLRSSSAGDARGTHVPSRQAQLAAVALGVTAKAPLRRTTTGAFANPPGTAPRVRLDEEEFVVVSTINLARRTDILKGTRGEAKQALADYLAAHPNERGTLQVVPRHEAV